MSSEEAVVPKKGPKKKDGIFFPHMKTFSR